MKLKRRLLQLVLWGLALLMLPTSLTAAPLVKRPLAPADTSSPRATLNSFVENINRGYQLMAESYDQYQQEPGLFPSTSVRQQVKQNHILFLRAKRTLNLSEIPPSLKQETGTEKALMLKEILDRIEVPPYAEIPDAEAVAADEELSRWRIPDTEIDIVKVESGPRAGEFLFSPETVASLEEFYEKVKNLPYKPNATEGVYQLYISTPGVRLVFKWIWFQRMPRWLNDIYWVQTLWQWIGLSIALLITFWIPYWCFRRQLRRAILPFSSRQQTWESLLYPLIIIATLVAVSYFLEQWLNLTGNVRLIVLTTLEIILWIVIALAIFIFGDLVAETIIASPKINAQGIDANAIRIVFRLSSLSIGTIVLIVGIERVGVSLTPIVAGLGIGGLALALAGRTTVENVIGGLVLFIDKPVRVGDLCSYGDQLGTVESIGLRSTRIRGLDRKVTTVPNADFSQMKLVNFTQRDRILLRKTIGLRYETTSEQLRFVLAKLRSMLLAHPKLLEEAARVRFLDYGDYSKDVEIYVYADTTDWAEFLGIQEDVLLRVQDIVEAAGTGFAFPSQTAYLSRDGGLDRERSRAAEAEVQAWRSKGLLPFPEFSRKQSEQFRDTLDFPPEGSPNARPASDNGNE